MSESTYLSDVAEVREVRYGLTRRACDLITAWADMPDREDHETLMFHLIPICLVLGRLGGPLWEDER